MPEDKLAGAAGRVSADSVLFVTLDSCRFDTFERAEAPAMKAVGPLHRAQAPCYFTYASHSAMFVGFLPVASTAPVPLLNPKFAKLFKLTGAGFPGKGPEGYALRGRDIIDGFREAGFATLGASGIAWFDPDLATGQHLTRSFEQFRFLPGPRAREHAGWLQDAVASSGKQDVFAFLNLSETHVPYHHEGAPWPADDNPCIPFQTVDRAADCAIRQRACVEYLDGVLTPLLEMFSHATIVVTADHGDCWGEDGLWEHGIPHPMTLTVPLLMRLRGAPV
jgi:hypothetical protein